MNEHIEGIGEARRNLKVFERKLLDRLVNAIEFVAIAIVVHIQVTYQRPISGKGFTDRTGLLRQSITHKVTIERGMIIAWIFASGGDENDPDNEAYAQHVEYVSGGKFAFMLPGFLDMKREIVPLILKEMKRRGLILK